VRNLWNFGSGFGAGILNPYPGPPTGKYYPNSLPKVDIDGNDIPGIRLPEVVAPVATNSGWGLRAAAFGGLVAARAAAANALLAKRLLLQDDVDAYISNAALPIKVIASPTYGDYMW
jgi:hypothetical protein